MNVSSWLDDLAKPFQSLAPLLLRFSLGISFILYGYNKFPIADSALVTRLDLSVFTSYLVALGEIGAGVAVIAGGFIGSLGHLITRLGGGAVVVIMTGAFILAHGDWFITQKLFMSEQIFLFALGLYFAIKGNK